MEPPEGCDIPKVHVFFLKKAIYVLKQAGHQWYRKLCKTMAKFDLKQVRNEPHSFIAHKVVNGINRTLIMPIYVDDLFPIGDKVLMDKFEAWIGNYFEITPPCDAHYFLGICVKRDWNPPKGDAYISVDQINYADSILAQLSQYPKPKPTPLPSARLTSNSDPIDNANPNVVREYQSAIGQLMYIMLGTCPDLAHAVGMLSRFTVNPSPDHF